MTAVLPHTHTHTHRHNEKLCQNHARLEHVDRWADKCYLACWRLITCLSVCLFVCLYEVLRDTAVVTRCHPLFLRPVPYYLPGRSSFKLCLVDYILLGRSVCLFLSVYVQHYYSFMTVCVSVTLYVCVCFCLFVCLCACVLSV